MLPGNCCQGLQSVISASPASGLAVVEAQSRPESGSVLQSSPLTVMLSEEGLSSSESRPIRA